MSTYRMPTIKSFMRYLVLRRAASCCTVPACHALLSCTLLCFVVPCCTVPCRVIAFGVIPCGHVSWVAVLSCLTVPSTVQLHTCALLRLVARRRSVPCRLADSPVGGEGQKSTDHAPTATREHPKTAATAAHPAHALARLLPQRRGRRAPGSQ